LLTVPIPEQLIKNFAIAGAIVLSTILAACGGGGDGGNVPPVPSGSSIAVATAPPSPRPSASPSPSPTPSPTPLPTSFVAEFSGYYLRANIPEKKMNLPLRQIESNEGSSIGSPENKI
jgi:hypothetical protein